MSVYVCICLYMSVYSIMILEEFESWNGGP